MSYQKKNVFGQYLEVAGLGADDPWADTASSPTPAPAPSGGGVLESLFGAFSTAGSSLASPVASAGHTVAGGSATPPKPSTVSQVGAGIGAFLSNLGKPPTPPPGVPVMPYRPGMSTTTKLALAGGGALLLVLLLTRD